MNELIRWARGGLGRFAGDDGHAGAMNLACDWGAGVEKLKPGRRDGAGQMYARTGMGDVRPG